MSEARENLTADELLERVHARLGIGVDLITFADGTVEVRWGYRGAGPRDERSFATGKSLRECLAYILQYEDEADARDAEEEAQSMEVQE